ncbi:MAG: endonuclease domain-containing protein [bacterium]|nr:endonuclease domain-containing protein [bacterium]
METRPCKECGENRPIEEFGTYPYGGSIRTRQNCKLHDGVSTGLPAVISAAPPLAQTHPHPAVKMNGHYNELFKKQGGRCAICSQPETSCDEIGQALPLSLYGAAHYGARRMALLCKLCNMGLSMFRDSPALLARAIAFLTQKGPTAEADVRILSDS